MDLEASFEDILRLRSRSTLLRCAAGVALCVALQAALSFVAPASGAAKAWSIFIHFDFSSIEKTACIED